MKSVWDQRVTFAALSSVQMCMPPRAVCFLQDIEHELIMGCLVTTCFLHVQMKLFWQALCIETALAVQWKLNYSQHCLGLPELFWCILFFCPLENQSVSKHRGALPMTLSYSLNVFGCALYFVFADSKYSICAHVTSWRCTVT